MAEVNLEKLSLLPEEMLSFTLSSIQRSAKPESLARIGQLALKGRSTIKTPHYIANTSRGVVPHVSQDNLVRYCHVRGLYVGLEDCMFSFPSHG